MYRQLTNVFLHCPLILLISALYLLHASVSSVFVVLGVLALPLSELSLVRLASDIIIQCYDTVGLVIWGPILKSS